MVKSEFKSFVSKYDWIYAKTYADKAPHEYLLKEKLISEDMSVFEQAVSFIRDNGFLAFFWGQEYTYYYMDGHYYWTMGEPVSETILINRCEYNLYEMRYVGEEKA